MSDSPLVVVGSGPAGLAAAQALRAEHSERAVLMITSDQHPPYARPPLTKDFLTGESSLDELWLIENSWFDDHQVDLLLGREVVDIDRGSRSLRLDDGSTQGFGQLILATGSRPQPLPIPGGDDPGLILVRDLESGLRLRRLAEARSRVAVLGSGFIGCETAASLSTQGCEVVLITRESVPHEKRLGSDAGRQIARWLTEVGVELQTGTSFERISRSGSGWAIALSDHREVKVDAVVSGSGVVPNVELAQRAGLDLSNGGIGTDSGMRTSDPSIFAVGDIAYAEHAVLGRRLRVEHWGDAEEQGKVAGLQVAGWTAQWREIPGFWSTIGAHTLTYAAWGDGFEDYRVVVGDAGSWTVWYRSGELLSGVLAAGDEEAYERGRQQLRDHTPFDQAG